MDNCTVCKDEIRFYGYCSCQENDGLSPLAILTIMLVTLSFLYVFLQWFMFGSGYVYEQDRVVAIIQAKEGPFIANFHQRVQNDPNLEITGWKCDMVCQWGLVTYHYTASLGADKPPERRAYFWAVNTNTNEVFRLASLEEFIAKYLLAPAPLPA